MVIYRSRQASFGEVLIDSFSLNPPPISKLHEFVLGRVNISRFRNGYQTS